MLNIFTISKDKYNSLTTDEQMQSETMFLVKDTQGHGSIYVQGICHGEDLDDDEIYRRINEVENELDNFEMATNFDILEILNN